MLKRRTGKKVRLKVRFADTVLEGLMPDTGCWSIAEVFLTKGHNKREGYIYLSLRL